LKQVNCHWEGYQLVFDRCVDFIVFPAQLPYRMGILPSFAKYIHVELVGGLKCFP